MKVKFVFVVLFSLFSIVSIYGQTASDFEKNYGSVKYYEIRPHTLISPAFDKNGQVCSVMIRANPFPLTKNKSNDINEVPESFKTTQMMYFFADTNHLFPIKILNSTELKEVFDEIVPPKTRKGKGISSVDISGFGARYTTKFKFENIIVNTVIVPYEKAVFNMKAIGENLDLFFNPPYGATESAVVIWTERKCIEK